MENSQIRCRGKDQHAIALVKKKAFEATRFGIRDPVVRVRFEFGPSIVGQLIFYRQVIGIMNRQKLGGPGTKRSEGT